MVDWRGMTMVDQWVAWLAGWRVELLVGLKVGKMEGMKVVL